MRTKKGIEKKVRTVISATNKVQPYSARMAIKKKFFAEIHESLGGRLDLLVSGGAPIDPDVIAGMRDFGINIIQGYGLTESAPLAAVNHDKYFSDRSAGLTLPGGELKIIDVQEDGTGEICYRGDNVMLGYYNNDEATKETFTINVEEQKYDTLNYEVPEQEWFNNLKQITVECGFCDNMKVYKKNKEAYKGHIGDVASIIRIAMCTKTKSPNLYNILQILGKERYEERSKEGN